MTIRVIEHNSKEAETDPNYYGLDKLGAGESFAAGNYGTLVFDAATGDVLRYYVSDEGPEYADIVKMDVVTYRNKLNEPIGAGACEDILYIGFWTKDGEYVASELTPDESDWKEKAEAELRTRYAIGLEDAGLSDDDVRRYFKGEPDPAAWAEWYGIKYDLDQLDPDHSPAREQALANGENVED